jgi:nicotinamidase-related amidase
MKQAPRLRQYTVIVLCAISAVAGLTAANAFAQTIVDEWATVKVPAAPELKSVTIDPKATALLVMDINKQTCNTDRRPRCVAAIPKVQKLLADARAKGVPVIYSLSGTATPADIMKELAPREGEPVLPAVGPDKFLGTDLEKILTDKGIKAVITVGTAAHGAVLHTASAAALRGMQVIVPVDAMSADTAYPEQYTTWHLANAARVSARVTLTKVDLIRY